MNDANTMVGDMKRPEFESIRDYDEFCKYYWFLIKASGASYPIVP